MYAANLAKMKLNLGEMVETVWYKNLLKVGLGFFLKRVIQGKNILQWCFINGHMVALLDFDQNWKPDSIENFIESCTVFILLTGMQTNKEGHNHDLFCGANQLHEPHDRT